MNLQLVKSEFSIKNKRIDTLAMIKIYEVLKETIKISNNVPRYTTHNKELN